VEEGEQTSSWLGVADQQGPGNTGGSTRVMLGGKHDQHRARRQPVGGELPIVQQRRLNEPWLP